MKQDTKTHGENARGVELWRNDVQEELESRSSCQLPSYSSIDLSSSPADRTRSCCALGKFDPKLGDFSKYKGLLEHSKRLHFLCWVAYCRNLDEKLLETERLCCPMIWCRQSFAKGEEVDLINHVAACPSLADGEYYCPYCQRKESYITMVEPLSRRHSHKQFVKHTMDAIRRLGSKSVRKALNHHKPPPLTISKPFGGRPMPGNEENPYTISCEKQPLPDIVIDEDRTEKAIPSLSAAQETCELDGQDTEVSSFWPSATKTPHEHPLIRHGDDALELPATDCAYEMEGHSIRLRDTMYNNDPRDTMYTEDSWRQSSCPSMDWNMSNNITPATLSPVSPISPRRQLDGRQFVGFETRLSATDPWDADRRSADANELLEYEALIKENGVLDFSLSSFGDRFGKDTDISAFSYTENPQLSQKPSSEKYATTHAAKPQPINTNLANIMMASDPALPLSFEGQNLFTDMGSFTRSPLDASPEVPFFSRADYEVPDSPKCVKKVKDLRYNFHAVYDDTSRKMSQSPPSQVARDIMHKGFTEDSVFESSLLGLQKAIRGNSNMTLPEVFGIAHLAFATALASGEEDLAEQFGEIYMDIMDWADMIGDEADRLTMIELAWELWSSESCQRPEAKASRPRSQIYSMAETCEALCLPSMPPNAFDVSFLTGDTSLKHELRETPIQLQEEQSGTNQQIESVRAGIIYRLCCHYLRELEYDRLQSVLRIDSKFSTPLPSSTNRASRHNRLVRENVTDPLITAQGLEAFRPIVNSTCKHLNQSREVPLREVELKLLHDGKKFTRSRRLYTQFVDKVTRVCDNTAMVISWELPSRGDYYLEDIQQVLKIHNEMKPPIEQNITEINSMPPPPRKRRATERPAALSFAYSDVSAMTSTPFSALESPTWDSAPPSAHTSVTFHNDNIFIPNMEMLSAVDDLASHLSTPGPTPMDVSTTEASTTKSSPQTQSTNTSNEDIIGSRECHVCKRVLRGKVAWLPSNMQRHMREKHSSVPRERLVCKVSGCGKTFGRKHNMVTHMRTVHPDLGGQ